MSKSFNNTNGRKYTTSLSGIIKQEESELPSLLAFNVEEIPSLKKRIGFFLNSRSSEDEILNYLNVKIYKEYLEKLENDQELHPSLFIFFLKYLKQFALQTPEKTHKMYLVALEIQNYLSLQSLQYSFLPQFENLFDDIEDLQPFQYMIFLIKIDQRWVILLVNTDTLKPIIIDFIYPQLGKRQINDLIKIFRRLFSQEFKGKNELKQEDFMVITKPVEKVFSDYGLYVASMTYLLWFEDEKDSIEKKIQAIKIEEMNKFNQKIVWLIYIIIIKESISTNNFLNLESNNDSERKDKLIINNSEKNTIFDKNSFRISNDFDKNKNSKNTSVSFKKNRENEQNKQENNLVFSKKMLIEQLKTVKNEILNKYDKKTHIKASEVDKFIEEEVQTEQSKNNSSSNFALKFSKNQLKKLLIKYQDRFRTEYENKKESHQDHLDQTINEKLQYFNNYNQFQNLLWFYYYYDKNAYRELIEEYNKRLHNHLLLSLGLPAVPTTQSKKLETPRKIEKFFSPPPVKKQYQPQYNVSLKTELSERNKAPDAQNFSKNLSAPNLLGNSDSSMNTNSLLFNEKNPTANTKRGSIMKRYSIFRNMVSKSISNPEQTPQTYDQITESNLKIPNSKASLPKINERPSITNNGTSPNYIETLKSFGRLSILNPNTHASTPFGSTDQKLLNLLSNSEVNNHPNNVYPKNHSYLNHRKSRSTQENNLDFFNNHNQSNQKHYLNLGSNSHLKPNLSHANSPSISEINGKLNFYEKNNNRNSFLKDKIQPKEKEVPRIHIKTPNGHFKKPALI